MPQRKSLPHQIPLWINPQAEIYFISINCQARFRNQLAVPNISERLLETVRHRQQRFLWWPHVFLLMPDHLHTLISFPPSGKPFKVVIRKWKEADALICAPLLKGRWRANPCRLGWRMTAAKQPTTDLTLKNSSLVRLNVSSILRGTPRLKWMGLSNLASDDTRHNGANAG